MNFFDGQLKTVNGELVFEEGQLRNARVAGPTPGTLAAVTAASGNGKTASDEPVVMVGELTMPGNGFRLAVPAHLRDRLGSRVGTHVVLGLRPEHFHLKPTGGQGDCCPMKVDLNVVEPLGNDMDIYMNTQLHDHVVGRVEATPGLTTGQEATVFVDLSRVHLFEPGATGMNLSLGAGQASPPNEPAHAAA